MAIPRFTFNIDRKRISIPNLPSRHDSRQLSIGLTFHVPLLQAISYHEYRRKTSFVLTSTASSPLLVHARFVRQSIASDSSLILPVRTPRLALICFLIVSSFVTTRNWDDFPWQSWSITFVSLSRSNPAGYQCIFSGPPFRVAIVAFKLKKIADTGHEPDQGIECQPSSLGPDTCKFCCEMKLADSINRNRMLNTISHAIPETFTEDRQWKTSALLTNGESDDWLCAWTKGFSDVWLCQMFWFLFVLVSLSAVSRSCKISLDFEETNPSRPHDSLNPKISAID